MRLYSNVKLNWPQVLHLHTGIQQLSLKKWKDFHIYKVHERHPLTIHSASPLTVLGKNRQYYCYENYLHTKSYDNTYSCCQYTPVYDSNLNYNDELILLHYPQSIAKGDAIVVYE